MTVSATLPVAIVGGGAAGLTAAAHLHARQQPFIVLEAGAEAVRRADDNFEIICDPAIFAEVGTALAQHGIEPELSEILRIPTSTVDLDAEIGKKVLELVQKLDDHDDVQSVSSNFNIPEEAMAAMQG